MKKRLALLSAVFMAAGLLTAIIAFSPAAQAAGGKTGVGLAEHGLKAYRQGWKYQPAYYGQFLNGVRASDCSGLIKSYLWWTGETTNPRPGMAVAGSSSGMLSSASAKGTINYSDASSLPRIHGLVLYQPGHVGIYVGNNMAVDNRATGMNMKYEPVFGRSRAKWTMWLKLPQITYPTTGLVTFNGQLFYYENGQYVVNTTRTVGGKQYTFGASGASTSSAPAAAVTQSKAAPKSSPSKSSSSKAAASVKPAAPAYTDLSVNMKGDAVKALQQRLKDLGYYYESVNTYYDQMVVDAVKTYQAAAKLSVTGKADAATQKSIFDSTAPENPNEGTLTPGMHSSLVKNMQARLIALGYMSGEPSVFYNDAAKEAVMAYQKAAGLAQDGVMTGEALDQLYSDSAVKASAVSSLPASSAASSAASSVKSEARIYEDVVPKANAATVDQPKSQQNSGVGITLFFVAASGLFTLVFMLVKKMKKDGVKNPLRLFSRLPNVKSLLPAGLKK